MNKIWFISENKELDGISKILGRVNFHAVPVCLGRCREVCIEMWVVLGRQTLFLIFETIEVPQNFFKARRFTQHLWHAARESDIERHINYVARTLHDDRMGVRKGAKEMELDYPRQLSRPTITHWLGIISIEN
jgi:hypothetical protein